MWERDFDWYNFLPPRYTKWGGSKLDVGIAAKRRKIEQHFVLRGIRKSWVHGLSIGAIPNPLKLPLPQNWGSQNPPFNYGQTAADVATL